MTVEPGQEAPDFELRDQQGNMVSLANHRGDKAVVLVFYPFTFTGVCQGELCELRDDIGSFEAENVQVLAISCDSSFAQKKWAEEQGFTFPVLSDFWPHGAVSKAYGVFNDALGCAMRHTFLIDKNGVVVDHFDTDHIATPREQARYEEALAKL